jgi:hypothetical protein
MVDWNRVEAQRSKGRNWDELAEDPKVQFKPPEGIDDAGKALKALYYSRKSRGKSSKKKGETKDSTPVMLKKGLIPIGLAVTIIGAIWFVLALETSLVGVWLQAYPYVLLVVVAGVFIFAAGLVMGAARLTEVWKKPVAVGIVIGLLLSGGLALFAGSLGVPILNPDTFQEGTGQGWMSETPRNGMWTQNGLPVLFFLGSDGCMFCAASSWAVYEAVQAGFGTLSDIHYTNSVNDDHIPEVDWCSTQVTSQYISWDPKEGCDNAQVSVPGTTLIESAYVHMYNSCTDCGYPFYIVGGPFIHRDLVSPYTSGLSGLPYATMLSILENSSINPGIYNAVHTSALYLEAYLVKADQLANIAPPSAVTSDAIVMSYVGEIT